VGKEVGERGERRREMMWLEKKGVEEKTRSR
jgi:hypothetical protein